MAKQATKLSNLSTQISKRYQKAYKFVSKLDRKSHFYVAVLIFASCLLLITSVYAGKHASDDYSTNSNAHMLTHIFSGDTEYPVVLPGPHATLLVIPLVYVQGRLPYHYTSFTLVNIGLVVATMFGWALLMIKLFGRKYEVPILIILSSLIFTSVAFSYSLAYTTIRNIQYPIVLWFVMIVASVLSGAIQTRRQKILSVVGTILFVITLAGDSFFNYAIMLPLLLVIGWYWIQSRQFTLNMAKALGLLGGAVVGTAFLKFALSAAGIITFDYSYWGQNTIIDSARLVPSFSVALTEGLKLHGAYIFNQILDPKNMSVFVNFGLLLLGFGGLFMILSQANRNYRNKKGLKDENNFVVVVMAISFFVTFLIFALSGYAIATLPSGQIVSAENARYISLLPLITVISLLWILKNYYAKHAGLVVVLCTVLVAGIVTSYPVIRTAYASDKHKLEISASLDSINQMIFHLNNNEVTQVSADYWYADVLRFWSKNTISTTGPVSCDSSLLSDPSSLFTKQKHNTALIIDRGDRNYAFWSCTDSQLTEIYGVPNERYEVAGAGPNEPVKIWIYKATP